MPNAAQAKRASRVDTRRLRLRDLIAEQSLLRNRTYKLASGQTSGFYFDMKRSTLDPEGATLIADAILDLLEGEEIDGIGGLAVGAVPIVAAVCVRSHLRHPLRGFFVRQDEKKHGTESAIGGHLPEGSRVVLFDDVTTSGGSVLKAAEAVRARGCTVTKVITIVDRLEGAGATLAKHGLELIPIFTRDDFLP